MSRGGSRRPEAVSCMFQRRKLNEISAPQKPAQAPSSPLRYVQNSLARLAKENATETQGLLALELSRLDDLCRAAYAVLDAEHPLISGGAVVEHEGLRWSTTGMCCAPSTG